MTSHNITLAFPAFSFACPVAPVFIRLSFSVRHCFTPSAMSGLRSARTSSSSFLLCLSFLHTVLSQTGYEYVLDTEYSGETFFDGWNFFTVSTLSTLFSLMFIIMIGGRPNWRLCGVGGILNQATHILTRNVDTWISPQLRNLA